MSEHVAQLSWTNTPHPQEDGTYSRNHTSTLNGGQVLNVSASVEYKGDPECADPEQMLVSALASCHMLFFLAIAEVKGFPVATYDDKAVGTLEKNTEGRLAITRIALHPKITFVGDAPDEKTMARIHDGAHRNCFIAHSIKADVTVGDA